MSGKGLERAEVRTGSREVLVVLKKRDAEVIVRVGNGEAKLGQKFWLLTLGKKQAGEELVEMVALFTEKRIQR